jgi:hypothetical protein
MLCTSHSLHAARIMLAACKEALAGDWFIFIQSVHPSSPASHETRCAGMLTANDELLNEFEEELQQCAQDAQREGRDAKAARLAAADAAVNLVSELHDGFSGGYGTRHGSGVENASVRAAGTQASDIAQELNMHASVVLAGRGAEGGVQGQAVFEERSRSGLEDLKRREVWLHACMYLQMIWQAARMCQRGLPVHCCVSSFGALVPLARPSGRASRFASHKNAANRRLHHTPNSA